LTLNPHDSQIGQLPRVSSSNIITNNNNNNNNNNIVVDVSFIICTKWSIGQLEQVPSAIVHAWDRQDALCVTKLPWIEFQHAPV
jgi:hypothetical protein